MLCSPTVQAEPCESTATRKLSGPIQSGEEPESMWRTLRRLSYGVPCDCYTQPPPSFVDRHIGARRQADVDTMLKAVGYDTVDAPRGHRRPEGHPPGLAARARQRPQRSRGPRRAAQAGREEQDRRADDRPGLLRHRHPGRDPPQHPRSPGLVHRLHPVPAGDLPGPARGAAELPDHGPGPRRPARSPTPPCWTKPPPSPRPC